MDAAMDEQPESLLPNAQKAGSVKPEQAALLEEAQQEPRQGTPSGAQAATTPQPLPIASSDDDLLR